jgi:large subunit ribosomal protein L32
VCGNRRSTPPNAHKSLVFEAMQVTGYPEGQLPTPDTSRGSHFSTPIEETSIMAVPKRRMSRANTRSRRAQWKAKRPELVSVTIAGQQHKVPRRLLKAARLGLIDLDRR